MTDKVKYISAALRPEVHAAFLEIATYRGMKPMALCEIALTEWMEMEASKMLESRVSVAMLASASHRRREVNDIILNEAKHTAQLIAMGAPDSHELSKQLTRFCEHLGITPDELIDEAGSVDYLKPTLRRSEINEDALTEILYLHPDGISYKQIAEEWMRRGLPQSMMERTKQSLRVKLRASGLDVVSTQRVDGWYWSIEETKKG